MYNARILGFLLFFIPFSNLISQSNKVDGIWLSEGTERTMVVKLFETTTGELRGEMLGFWENDKIEYSNFSHQDSVMFGFEKMASNSWSNGTFYDPKKDMYFNGEIKMMDRDSITATGSVFCFTKNMNWRRLDSEIYASNL